LKLKPAPGDPERTLLGEPDASRLAINTLGLVVGARLVSPSELDAFVEAQIDGAHIVVKPAPDEADSFLASLLGSEGISAELSFGVRLSSRSGFGFTGSGGLEASFPVHVALGPIEFQAVTLGLKLRGQEVDIEVGATVSGKLGPLAFVVERAGFKLSAQFPDPPTGNLGPSTSDSASSRRAASGSASMQAWCAAAASCSSTRSARSTRACCRSACST
jgi:hypothetical protein